MRVAVREYTSFILDCKPVDLLWLRKNIDFDFIDIGNLPFSTVQVTPYINPLLIDLRALKGVGVDLVFNDFPVKLAKAWLVAVFKFNPARIGASFSFDDARVELDYQLEQYFVKYISYQKEAATFFVENLKEAVVLVNQKLDEIIEEKKAA